MATVIDDGVNFCSRLRAILCHGTELKPQQ
jgi:hypothetical protein